jgi:hypothetical protein
LLLQVIHESLKTSVRAWMWMIEYRELGRSEIKVSAIGIGMVLGKKV